MGKCKDEEDKDLVVTFTAEQNKFLWWNHYLYKCEVYRKPICTKPYLKGWTPSYIASRIKILVDIKGERNKRVKPFSYMVGMSSKWSKERLDEAIEDMVDNIIKYNYGEKKIRWEMNQECMI
jgi:hypothetical protein